jgi:hypothetical protein
MGLFFDKTSEPLPSHVLQAAYREQPPRDEYTYDQLRLSLLSQAHEQSAVKIENALRTPAMSLQEAQHEASRVVSSDGGAQKQPFHAWRFAVALGLFAALVGAGIGTDAANMTASSGALFGFAGGVFGVVTAFLGVEKDS